MTVQSCILNNSHPNEWATAVQEKHWPVILPPTEKKATNSDLTSPQLVISGIKSSQNHQLKTSRV